MPARRSPLLLCLSLAACGPAASTVEPHAPVASASVKPAAPAVRVAFEIPRDGAAVDLTRTPWPTELARLADGHLDLRAYPGRDSALITEYLTRAAEDLDGFSIAPVIYFRFEGPIDLASQPTEDVSRTTSAPIALLDVDPASPERGTAYPLALRATSRDMRYLRSGTLAVRPLDGFALRPGTLHAAFVRRSFGGLAGGLGVAPDLEVVLSKTPRADAAEERARALHAPAIEALEALGVPRDELAAVAVFRTGRPHVLTEKLVGAVDALFAPPAAPATTSPRGPAKPSPPSPGPTSRPRIVSAEWDAASSAAGLYRVLRGAYCTPNFQSKIENAPFVEREGGRVLTDAEGVPTVAPVPKTAPFAHLDCPGQLRVRFVLSVPESPMPAEGFPLLVTAHGTGGDAFSFLGPRDFAGWAAAEGFAAVSTDQPVNGGAEGGRPGASGPLVLPLGIPVPDHLGGPALAFYNPLYPGATAGNLHQAAADAAVLVRLFGGLDVATLRGREEPALLLASKRAADLPRFDARRTALAGHSQGCQSLGVLGAVDPLVRGVLLSGCGGDARLGILHRRNPPFAPWVAMTLGLDPEELSAFHPVMALVQSLADRIDPLAFARHYWEPLPGRAPQRVLHFEGLRDGYTPEISAEALAVALRAAPAVPLVKPVRGLALLGPLAAGERQFAQYLPKASPDGHFVLYYEVGPSDVFRDFLRTTPRVTPPAPPALAAAGQSPPRPEPGSVPQSSPP